MRVLIAFLVVLLTAPIGVETADAQVWKVKKKAGAGAKTATKTKAKPARTSRPAVKKKRPSSKPRKVDLVPDEDEDRVTEVDEDRPRKEDPADEPIFIQVEELD